MLPNQSPAEAKTEHADLPGATSPQKNAAGNSSKGRGYMLQGQHPRRRGLTAPLDSPFHGVSPPENPDQRRGLWTRNGRACRPCTLPNRAPVGCAARGAPLHPTSATRASPRQRLSAFESDEERCPSTRRRQEVPPRPTAAGRELVGSQPPRCSFYFAAKRLFFR